MSVVSAIPGVGKLFGEQKEQGRSRRKPSSSRPHGPDPSTNSYMSGSGSYMSGGPGSPVADVSPPGDTGIMEKIVDIMDSFALPALIFGARSLVKREIAPLVGRYAADYPLVEAEEEAGSAPRPIRRGDPEEFKFAAPGLRYKDIDQRLENVVLRPFSKVRKFRRAPEVWDDTEALAIADKVKAHNNAARHAVNVERTRRTRSLGTAQNANNESLPNPRRSRRQHAVLTGMRAAVSVQLAAMHAASVGSWAGLGVAARPTMARRAGGRGITAWCMTAARVRLRRDSLAAAMAMMRKRRIGQHPSLAVPPVTLLSTTRVRR
ncbi:hypothetical protein DL89DRAFT_58441 [Linderina pennispora]|uniref:Uncharacterized protein n=1 Tax=Linderina pennispora TaxID=61395 RepID=A0A1Y1VZL3_9FUNG|nr:uncharacterized protein DL89DRAFT_58441 [Linderina pennispora]ORX66700.1 hypothetical protein DL89DRAFT_58441 [Linderina pennispora]